MKKSSEKSIEFFSSQQSLELWPTYSSWALALGLDSRQNSRQQLSIIFAFGIIYHLF
jgi:hypothetical protein